MKVALKNRGAVLGFFFVFSLSLAAIPSIVQADTPAKTDDVAIMLELARQHRMAELPEWHKILTYYRSFGHWKNRVDDSSYFLAADGRQNPHAELEATIQNAFDHSYAQNSPQSQLCRFIARYQFLSREMQKLGFHYPEPTCIVYQQWRKQFSTSQLTLVFASVYLNRPASLYGHTFLRFDGAPAASRLNSMTIGYTVGGQRMRDPFFIVKTMLGSYPGEFAYVPFYMKLREYSDLESRDLWEFETDFGSEEIERILAFVWEHSFARTDYYFFDDNCAMMLLAAMEAGRPSLNLLNHTKPWIIPLDVVKLVRAQPGLVSNVHFRPSQFNTVQFRYFQAAKPLQGDAIKLLNASQQQAVLDSYDNIEKKTHLLDLTLAMLEYQRNSKTSINEAAPIGQYQIKLAIERSKSSLPTTFVEQPRPTISPDEGHNSFRTGIAFGQIGNQPYGQINLRGSNHDELDPESGYASGARSIMGDLYVRFDQSHIDLERLDIFDVFAPSVISAWFTEPSIKFHAAVQREVFKENSLSPLFFSMDTGVGITLRASNQNRIFLMTNMYGRIGGVNSIHFGPSIGFIAPITSYLRADGSTSASWSALGEQQGDWLYRASIGISVDTFNAQNNVRLHAVRQKSSNRKNDLRDYVDFRLAYSHYF